MDSRNKERVYLPIVMNQMDATRELDHAWGHDHVPVWNVVTQVRDVVMSAGLTPLQAQAVLVRAWAQVQTGGQISRSPQGQAPSRPKTEAG